MASKLFKAKYRVYFQTRQFGWKITVSEHRFNRSRRGGGRPAVSDIRRGDTVTVVIRNMPVEYVWIEDFPDDLGVMVRMPRVGEYDDYTLTLPDYLFRGHKVQVFKER